MSAAVYCTASWVMSSRCGLKCFSHFGNGLQHVYCMRYVSYLPTCLAAWLVAWLPAFLAGYVRAYLVYACIAACGTSM